MKFYKSLLFVFVILLVQISCTVNSGIEGIYYVNNNVNDKVYVELLNKEADLYKIFTPNKWEEIAFFDGKTIKGNWEYPDDYYNKKERGLKGIHVGRFSKKDKRFDVQLLSNNGESWGKATWTKLVSKKMKKQKKPTIYLTFDDGPLKGTDKVMKCLEDLEVKATFFVVGKHARELSHSYEYFLKELKKNKRFLIANHSYTHANDEYEMYYSNPKTVLSDLKKNRKEVLKYHSIWTRMTKGNINGKIARLPGRNVWVYKDYEFYDLPDVESMSKNLKKADYNIFGWDVEWKIKNGTIENSNHIKEKIEEKFTHHKTKFNNKCVVLMHDQMFNSNQSIRELKRLIQSLKTEGYKFDTLDNF